MKRALITGITGQDGSYLAELLLSKGYEVYGLYRRSAAPKFDNIHHIKDDIQLVCGDVTDPTSINDIISSLHFHEVYNLAAQSFVGASFSQPRLTFEIDTLGVLNILETIRKYSPKTKFYQASTSEMFGSNYSVQKTCTGYAENFSMYTYDYDNKFQNENTPFQPESPYGVAKVAAHQLCQLYRKAYGLHISCGILFNHESPRRGEEFVTRKITKWMGEFAKWSVDNSADYKVLQTDRHNQWIYLQNKNPNEMSHAYPKLALGNLQTVRDWGHAKDYVRGMWMMLQQEVPDDYVLCTGKTHTIQDILKICFHPKVNPADFIYQDPKFLRPSEVPYLKGSAQKAKDKLGWVPEISFQDLIKDMLKNDLGEYYDESSINATI